jgi:chemotaxis protein MotB
VAAGFDARNLAASGYGEFDPVAANDTEENKQLNRRIEIILVPDLSELPSLTSSEP